MKAPDICNKAAELMADRGKERDQEGGERSMARCVHTFNAMTGHALSVEDGWLFMVYLKHARMRGGNFKMDDYEDAVAYEALMAEEALASAPVTAPVTAPNTPTLGPLLVPEDMFFKPRSLDRSDSGSPAGRSKCRTPC